MQNTELVVIDGREIGLKEEASMLFEKYATDCLGGAKAPLKQLLCSLADRAINRLIGYLRQKLAV